MQCRRAKQDYDLYNLPGGKWTLYDLRRTVATRMEELGVERDMVARVLAHARPDAKTTGRYARHTHWEQRCKTLDLLGSALEHCENGQLPLVEGGNVVQLKRA
jgi:integrase